MKFWVVTPPTMEKNKCKGAIIWVKRVTIGPLLSKHPETGLTNTQKIMIPITKMFLKIKYEKYQQINNAMVVYY